MHLFGTIGIAIGIAYVFAESFKLQERVRYIFVAVGAILPDLIDKPLGVLLYGSISNGRIFAHSMVFLIGVLAIGIFIIKLNNDSRVVCLSFGISWHLIENMMWKQPVILFWPLYGDFPLKKYETIKDWTMSIVMQLGTPESYIPEIIGFIIICLFLSRHFKMVKK